MRLDAVTSRFKELFQGRTPHNTIKFRNQFKIRQYRQGDLIREIDCYNAVVTVGKNDLLDVAFGGGTQKTLWYFGLINNTPTPTLLVADTLASHTGWVEWTSYAGNRKEWLDAAASGGSKGTSSLSSFTINASGNVYGAFLASVDTGTSGILWAHTAFPDPIPVINADVVKLNYTISVLTE